MSKELGWKQWKKQDFALERLRREMQKTNHQSHSGCIEKEMVLEKIANDSVITLIFWALVSFA